MNKMIALLVVVFGFSAFADWRITSTPPPAMLSGRDNSAEVAAQKASESAAQRQYLEKMTLARAQFVSVDPYRAIDGVTNSVLADKWYRISGRVLESHPDGVRIQGTLSRPFEGSEEFVGEFFAKGLPASFADDAQISNTIFVAKQVDHYTYTTVGGTTRKLVCVDYGKPCGAPPQVIELAKRKAEEKKIATTAALLKHYESLAAKGEPYGLYQMGLRYTVGDGVAKDEKRGREYLERASKLGSAEAAATLKRYFPEPVEIQLVQ